MKLAVVGATGNVGRIFLKELESRNFKVDEIVLYASKRSAGKKISSKWGELEVLELSDENIDKLDETFLAFFTASSEVSKQWAKKFLNKKIQVVDDSSAFRKDKNVPLVVPQINGYLVNANLVSNPNCSTIPVALILDKVIRNNDIEYLHVATYQALSGAGRKLVETYEEDRLNKGFWSENIVPVIGEPVKGYEVVEGFEEELFLPRQEEEKIPFELTKILAKDFFATSFCVRVPVYVGHSEVLFLKLKRDLSLNNFIEKLENSDLIKFKANITPKEVEGKDEVFVGRVIKKDGVFILWIISDNLRRGAATNVLDIIEKKLHYGLV